jgi:hypothetical protein
MGYHLASLLDNGVDVTASVTNGTYAVLNVTTNHNLVASFAINTYSVSAMVTSGSGTITPAYGIFNYGSPVTFTITPENGYGLGALTDNGVTVTATSAGNGNYGYTLASITGNHSIQASFTPAVISPAPGMGPWSFGAAVCGVIWIAIARRRKETGRSALAEIFNGR